MRRTPQQKRGQARVDMIINAALSAFSEYGFEATTTNMIAERAHVSIGSVYQFFENKDELIHVCTTRYLEKFSTDFKDALDTSYANAQSAIDSIIRFIIEFSQQNGSFLPFLYLDYANHYRHLVERHIVQGIDTPIADQLEAFKLVKSRADAEYHARILRIVTATILVEAKQQPTEVEKRLVTTLNEIVTQYVNNLSQ
jgi:AcrR family transcriptional regulator